MSKTAIPDEVLCDLEELAANGQMDAFSNGEVTNPKLMELANKVFEVVHWYRAPDCQRNHPSWNPEAEASRDITESQEVRSAEANDVI